LIRCNACYLIISSILKKSSYCHVLYRSIYFNLILFCLDVSLRLQNWLWILYCTSVEDCDIGFTNIASVNFHSPTYSLDIFITNSSYLFYHFYHVCQKISSIWNNFFLISSHWCVVKPLRKKAWYQVNIHKIGSFIKNICLTNPNELQFWSSYFTFMILLFGSRTFYKNYFFSTFISILKLFLDTL